MSGIYWVTQADFDNNTMLSCGHTAEDTVTLQAYSNGQFEVLCLKVAGPCGCYACNDEVQQGHTACGVPTPELLEREAAGEIRRSYRDGAWEWWIDHR